MRSSSEADMGLELGLGSTRTTRWLAAILLLVGFAMLLYRFPSVPVGLHQDEISEAYESYSLLHTGADRWGYRLPVYFLSWGSGQNVMQAYMTIPVVAVTGLTRVGARFIPVLCGLLTLPLFWLTLRRWCGETVALLGLLFLALSPWHILISRWGIENSPLPFFMILGLYTFGRALGTDSRWRILLAFVPFAGAMYTYGVVVIVIPLLLPLLCLIDPAEIRRQWKLWLASLGVFTVLALPLAFFVLKNYVTKTNYAFERWLPFSVPLLPITRLDQVTAEKAHTTVLQHNLTFFRHAFNDEGMWFMVPSLPPVQQMVLLFALVGIAVQTWKLIRDRRFSEPFLPVLLSCTLLIFKITLNISRGDALFLPLLALGAIGCGQLVSLLPRRNLQLGALAVVVVIFLQETRYFPHRYFGPDYAQILNSTFMPDLPAALAKAQQVAGPEMPLYVTDSIAINYVQVLFFTNTPPKVFQSSGATYAKPEFGRWRFTPQALEQTPRPFTFLLRKDDDPVCETPVDTIDAGQFVIGQCR